MKIKLAAAAAVVLSSVLGATASAQAASPRARVVAALRQQQLTMRFDGPFQYEFFGPKAGTYWNKSGEALLWQFRTRAKARRAGASIAPNGGTIGHVAVFWLGTPHWFRRGRVIALYLGSDTSTLRAFASVLGRQIAGG
jgi:hypothetical protein